jgi:signal transduction histidine kinase/ligand-binding sensor domain-containing protein/DNA-binding response OmpR family regulator
MWFGTHGGGLYRLVGDKWTIFDDATSKLPDDIVITVRSGARRGGPAPLWVGTRRGLAIVDGDSWSIVDSTTGLPNDVVMCIHESIDTSDRQTLWVGTRGGLARRSNGEWTCESEGAGLPCDSFLSLAETTARDGRRFLWAGTTKAGLACFDGTSWHVFDTSTGLPDNRVYALQPVLNHDGSTDLWVGTQRGLVRIDEHGNVVEEVGRLRDRGILTICLTPDRLGGAVLWIGTDGSGILRKGPARWIGFSKSAGLTNEIVNSITETRAKDGAGRLWLGGEMGISTFDGADWRAVPDGPQRTVRSLLATDDGSTVLAGTAQDGCVRLANGVWERLGEGSLPGNAVVCMCVTTEATGERVTWFGTDAGLARLDASGWSHFTTADGLPHHYVFALASTVDRAGVVSLWVGTNGGGLARLRAGRWTVYDTQSGLPNNLVLTICEVRAPDGSSTLWVGTQGGGVAMTSLDTDRPLWRVFSDETSPALPNNMVNAIRSDGRGRVYLFTNKGVARLTPRRPSAADPTEWSLYTFTTDDGLPSNECNAGAAFVDSLGRIWAGTVGGAAMLDPAVAVEDATPKPLHLSRVAVGGETRSLAPGASLTHRDNDVTFEFDLLSFFREPDTRYRTQLVGFDPRPSSWSPEWKRTYTNLPAGRYTFKVWGRDYAGNVTGPEELPFSVKPAPWRTWWAYAAYTGVAAGAVAGGVQWRLHTLRKRTEVLEETVSRQTAELASKVDALRRSESITREKADELARVVEQLRTAERNALAAKAEAITAKDKAIEASHAKSVFLSNMSHELRTPLNAVLGFAQLMERDAALTGEHRDHLTAIMTSGEHLLHLINDVLSLSKIEAGRLTLNAQPFELRRTLDGVEAMLRGRTRAKGLRLEVERGQSLPHYVLGDEGKLRQVLINLLGNAVKFTESGSITLRARWRNGIGEFEVKDTGYGIDRDELPTLFEPFVQTESGRNSKEGTGLGLAISRNFVQMMGGDIQVASQRGAGTVFSFDVELPEVAETSEQRFRRSVLDLEPGQPEFRILVVDDAEKNREILVKLLSSVGFLVTEASDGREAIALWSSWRPDLILMDMRMPVMDGRQATQEIRRREEIDHVGHGKSDAVPSRVKIISLTASAFEHEREEILASGCDDFLTKPFREAALFEKLAVHLGVRFRYAAEPETFLADGVPLEPERLLVLSADRLADLGDAVVKGDVEQALRIVDEIGDHDAPLAEELRGLVRAYRFDEIQDLLDRVAKV